MRQGGRLITSTFICPHKKSLARGILPKMLKIMQTVPVFKSETILFFATVISQFTALKHK